MAGGGRLSWRITRVVLIVIGALVALFLILLAYLWLSGRVWYPRQRSRVEALRDQETVQINEDRHAVTPLDDALPLDALRMIASHNSYHLQPDWIRSTLIGLVQPGEPAALAYSHQTLWDQLENGVRSFELDIRARKNKFTITHVPLVDNRGPNPDFSLALTELALWSQRRPGHVPIIVLLELKSDWMFLDPGLKQWDASALDRLDAVVRSSIPEEQLLTPAMVLRDAETLANAVDRYGWPTLGETRGRILFVVHTNETIDPLYVANDPGLSARPMFTSLSGAPGDDEPGDGERAPGERPDAVFVIHNEPHPESIAEFTGLGYIVRTRADGDGSATAEQRAAALESSAQIISTDLPPGHPNDQARGVVVFAPGKTLSQVSTR